MNIEQIRTLADADMQAVNQLIQEQVNSDVALINQLGFYIVNSGGKRLRPLLTVLAAKAMNVTTGELEKMIQKGISFSQQVRVSLALRRSHR